jgi:hypothetical protein
VITATPSAFVVVTGGGIIRSESYVD